MEKRNTTEKEKSETKIKWNKINIITNPMRNNKNKNPPIKIPKIKKNPNFNSSLLKKYPTVQVKFSIISACSLPFELCKYGKNPNLCIKVLYELAPTKVTKYHPEFKEEDITNIKKEIKEAKKEEASK